jgi:hypothetical protein
LWWCDFCLLLCLHVALHLLIFICWTIFGSLEWNQLDHCAGSF